MIEVDHTQGARIRELVAEGMDPDEAYRKVLATPIPTPKATATVAPKPKKKANTEPLTKQSLRLWLHENYIVDEEIQFHPTRKWRFDFYLRDHNLAVEYEGFMTKGANVGHASIDGIRRDIEKYNEAQRMGIRVFRASAENVRTGDFFLLIEQVTGKESRK